MMNLEQVRAMSDEELRIRVAELCGAKWMLMGSPLLGRTLVEGTCVDFRLKQGLKLADGTEKIEQVHSLKNYPRDLNAMHEAVETLDVGKRGRFMCELAEILEWPPYPVQSLPIGVASIELPFDRWFECANATARQRAEAFVLVMEAA